MKFWMLCRPEYKKSYSAVRFAEEAKQNKIGFRFVHPELFEIVTAGEDRRKTIFYKGKEIKLPDVVIPRMGAITTTFALAVIRQFERLGVRVLNGGDAIERAKDKLHALQILTSEHLPIPKTMLVKFPLDLELVKREFSFPIVLKTVSGSQGKGVMLCENEDDLDDIFGILEKNDTSLILQEFMGESRGRDIRVFVVGNRVIGAMLRTAQKGFKANVSRGGAAESFPLTPEIERIALDSARSLGLDIAGVDLLFCKKGFRICEVNSSPGFKGFEPATGANIPEAIFEYALQEKEKTKR